MCILYRGGFTRDVLRFVTVRKSSIKYMRDFRNFFELAIHIHLIALKSVAPIVSFYFKSKCLSET